MKQEISRNKGTRDVQLVTKNGLVKELFKNEEGLSIVGQSMMPNKKEQELTSPLKPRINIENNESRELVICPSKGKYGAGKEKWREVGKVQKVSMEIQEIIVSMKRTEYTETLVESEVRFQKKICDGEGKNSEKISKETAVVARQHRRDQ